MKATVRYSILGTVRAQRGDTELEPGPPKRLALLALLLLRAPGTLPLHEAVDLLWDTEPPASAVNVVHRHIGALRRTLEPELRTRSAAQHLVRAADGYRLAVDVTTSDLLHFRDLRSQAQLAVRSGDPAEGAALFLDALRLWRSPVVAAGSYLARHPLFTSVGHEYVAAVKDAADTVLTAAPALTEEILAMLRQAVEQHPFDEGLHSRIIASLAATGRQADALRQFEAIRRALADELGVDPGPGLRAAQQHLLRPRAVPESGAPAPRFRQGTGPGTGLGTGPGTIPAQLPADPASFAGRREVLAQCLELLPLEGEDRPPTMTAVICGMPGVGKTTLAVHWAHQVADRFPDGQVYVDMQGYHPSRSPLAPGQAMREVLDALGVRPRRTHTGAAGLGSLYRSALAGRQLLIVLDNAYDCEQVRPLLPGTPGCLALVTSRRRLEGLAVTDNARVITLDPMTSEEGLELLDRRLGTDRIRADFQAARELVDLCGGLPLALAVSSARALLNPTFPLSCLAARLRENRDTLTVFAGHDALTDARSVFSRSYDALGPGAADLFRLLSLHPSRDITTAAAASLTGRPLRTTREEIAELADHHLLVEQVPGRFTCHDLLRTYASELSAAHDTHQARSDARARMFEHYLYSADAATALIAPHRGSIILPPPRPGVLPQRFSRRTDAAEWIVAERYVLPALVEGITHHPSVETFRRQLMRTLEVGLQPSAR
ncbi:DNA-binding transcriptional activator of the SARP family [Actinacidiphila yanglinensis]|uniref:DNA-binding transcriptional activator of the SARP family n=2 Tax=Actinacidiphila yanglinensis TaxID=310779 RepID=A0A1H6E317_9ACTN|nr:DNA-binding transcriptional activator of the SARP family [Actinacidiphila yanglinensis]